MRSIPESGKRQEGQGWWPHAVWWPRGSGALRRTGAKPGKTLKHTWTHARPPFRLSTWPGWPAGAWHQVCLRRVGHDWSCDSSSVQAPPAQPQGSGANEAPRAVRPTTELQPGITGARGRCCTLTCCWPPLPWDPRLPAIVSGLSFPLGRVDCPHLALRTQSPGSENSSAQRGAQVRGAGRQAAHCLPEQVCTPRGQSGANTILNSHFWRVCCGPSKKGVEGRP